MKFTQTDINNLNNIISICSLVDIDAFFIEDGLLSGVNPDRTCVFLTSGDDKIPVLPENVKLSVSKLRILRDRLDIFKLDPKLSIEAVVKANNEISSLNIAGSNAKVQYRTAVRSTIKSPKAINDTFLTEVTITKEEAQTILTAIKAMGSSKLALNFDKKGKVAVELNDSNNDKFEIILENVVEKPADKSSGFQTHFFTDVFSAVIKAAGAENPMIKLKVFEASAIISINNYPLTLLCPMDSE